MENEKMKLIKFQNYSYINFEYDLLIKKIHKKIIYLFYIILFLIILLIIYLFLYNIFFEKFKNEIMNKSNDNTFISNNSLYNVFKYPQISLLIPNIENWNTDNFTIINLINTLRNQTLTNIEILFSLPTYQYTYNILKNISLIDHRIKIINTKNINLLYTIYNLMEKEKGKFIIILNKLTFFNLKDLEICYNLTKGKIDNIFKFKANDGKLFYLIKAKILKDIIDSDINFQNFNDLINYIINRPIPNLNYISVAFCLSNYYSAYTHVAMISILDSKNYYSYISFYLIIPNNFTQRNIYFLCSLYEQYDYFNITFIKIDDRYENAFISRYLTTHAYYRFSLGELIPYLDKIIYLDADVIVLQDLIQFYSLNFNGKVILGQPTFCNKSTKTGIYKINSGVLLLNLNKMRKIQMEKKVLYIINNGFKDDYHDQNLINYYFYNYVGIFPPKYHTRPFKNYSEIKLFNINTDNLYNLDYLYFVNKYPAIRHYLFKTKPIYDNTTNREDWWYFARKSKFYNEKTDNLSKIFNFTY